MYKLIRPILFQFDPEASHNAIVKLGGFFSTQWFSSLLHAWFAFEHPALQTKVFGLDFKNPVGLAPGYDKAGSFVRFMSALGFGFIEIGTVPPLPQPGNDKLRLFRLEKDQAIVNRMGFNSVGMKAVGRNLENFFHSRSVILGVNLGKNKATPNEQAADDYAAGFLELGKFADYIVINVSSPNTPGLRELQDKEPLRNLIMKLQEINRETPTSSPPHEGEKERRSKPLLLKVSADLSENQLDDIVSIAGEMKLDGVIACNTTVAREGLKTSKEKLDAVGQGGLSGRPLKDRATEVISYLYKKSNGAIPIIGVGGIFTAEDAYEKIQAGASLVQIYTGMIYEGPGLVKKIKKGLVELLEHDGFSNISQAVGADHR